MGEVGRAKATWRNRTPKIASTMRCAARGQLWVFQKEIERYQKILEVNARLIIEFSQEDGFGYAQLFKI